MNSGEKLGILVYLEWRLQEESMESKIMKFWSAFVEKSSEIEEKNFVREERENIKLSTIRLIYHSKLKK